VKNLRRRFNLQAVLEAAGIEALEESKPKAVAARAVLRSAGTDCPWRKNPEAAVNGPDRPAADDGCHRAAARANRSECFKCKRPKRGTALAHKSSDWDIEPQVHRIRPAGPSMIDIEPIEAAGLPSDTWGYRGEQASMSHGQE